MILEALNPLQIAFLIAAPLVVIFIVVVFIILPIKKSYRKNNFVEYCYKAIYKIAFDEDYYLINNFLFRADPSKVAKVDHILFGNKYIYVIIDSYFDGDLIGNDNDKSLIFIDRHNRKYYVDNQYTLSKTLVKYLSGSTGLDQSLMIGIVVVNNNCKIGVQTDSKQFYVIQRNKIKRLVRAIESRNVGKINAEQLASAVKAINKLNRTKKKQ